MDQARWLINKALRLVQLGKDKYEDLSSVGKATVWGYVAIHVIGFFIVLIITPARLFECKSRLNPNNTV